MKCQKCKANVGCACNLKDGMCIYCYNKQKETLIVNSPKND